MAKVYTKVGDKGETSLVGGQKVPKSDARLEAYGTIDELNSVLGVARAAIALERLSTDAGWQKLDADLESLQHWLFDLGSLMAALPADRERYKLPPIAVERVRFLEERIDAATALLKPLKTFILPGGGIPAAHLHVARTVARRAERRMAPLIAELPENAIPFINRVSDYLFVMARLCNHFMSVPDVVWKKTVVSASKN